MARIKKEIQTNQDYSAFLKMGNKVFESRGISVDDALSNLKPGELIKTRCLLTVTHGEKKALKMMKAPFVKRLLFYPTYRSIYSKQLNSMLR